VLNGLPDLGPNDTVTAGLPPLYYLDRDYPDHRHSEQSIEPALPKPHENRKVALDPGMPRIYRLFKPRLLPLFALHPFVEARFQAIREKSAFILIELHQNRNQLRVHDLPAHIPCLSTQAHRVF